MNILVTGAKGFVGKNLVTNLRNIAENKNRTRSIKIEEIFEYDVDTSPELLDEYCERADFVFNIAGVNRPQNKDEFVSGNVDFASTMLDTLKKYNNKAPVMLASSIQATLIGRYAESDYGKSKLAGEELFFAYSNETGAKTLVYRFPNLFGKWSRPNYNSAVATFCNAVANDLEYTVNNRETELELVYIDDLIEEMFDALEGKEHHCRYDGLTAVEDENGRYCYVPVSHKVTLGEIVDLLEKFNSSSVFEDMPKIPDNSFAKKLYSTYLSYLPQDKFAVKLNSSNSSLLMKMQGNSSVFVEKIPASTQKEYAWSNSQCSILTAICGKGKIKAKSVYSGEELKFEVSESEPKGIYILPGYDYTIINNSNKNELIMLELKNC